MKFQSLVLLIVSLLLFSCQDENKIRLIEQQKEAKKKEVIFNNINKAWVFNIRPLDPTVQGKINNWMEWRSFLTEINQKPKSTIGAFQKKAKVLSKKAAELKFNIPYEFNKPQIISRISVIETKIKSMSLFINLNQIQDTKVVKSIPEINEEIVSLQLQLEEIVRRSQIPREAGEPDRIQILDTTRAIPNSTPPKKIGIE
jgi:hypothetical protein